MSSSNTKTKSLLGTTWDYLCGRRPKRKLIPDSFRERIGGNQVGDFLLGAITKTYLGDMKEAADDLVDKRLEAQNRIKYSFSQSPVKTRYEKGFKGGIQTPLKQRLKHHDYEAVPLTHMDQDHWEKNKLPMGCMFPEPSNQSVSEFAYRMNQGFFLYASHGIWSQKMMTPDEQLVGMSIPVMYGAVRGVMAKDEGQRYRKEKRRLSELEEKLEGRSSIDINLSTNYSNR